MIQDTIELDEATPPWCIRLISELNAADDRAIALAGKLTPRQLNWMPRPGEWSVGQCLDHLRVANEVYCPAISDALVAHPLNPVQDITPGWLGRWFIRSYIEPATKTKRRRAPKKSRPGAEVELSVLDRFLETNRAARELVHRAGSYDVNRIRFRNPFIPVVRFTVGTGLMILSRHERRHLMQAERIMCSLEFPQREHGA